MSIFLVLPLEVVEHVLTLVNPSDLASVSKTCKTLHALLYKNNGSHVWRGNFLKNFDDPRRAVKLIAPVPSSDSAGNTSPQIPEISNAVTPSSSTRAKSKAGISSETLSDIPSPDAVASTPTSAHSPSLTQLSTSSSASSFDWRSELQKRVLAEKILLSRTYTRSTSTSYTGLSAVGTIGLAALVDESQDAEEEGVEAEDQSDESYGSVGPTYTTLYSSRQSSGAVGTITVQDHVNALRIVVGAVKHAVLPVAGAPKPDSPSKDLEWVEGLLKAMSISDEKSDTQDGRYRLYSTRFQRTPPPAVTGKAFTANSASAERPELSKTLSFIRHQTIELRLRAQLRVLRGYSSDEKHLVLHSGSSPGDPKTGFGRIKPGLGEANMRQSARARVYDLRRYTENNEWGPFLHDGSGRVDWEQIDALLVVVGMNIYDHVSHDHDYGHDDGHDSDDGTPRHHPTCPHVLHPVGLNASRGYSAPGNSRLFEFASGATTTNPDEEITKKATTSSKPRSSSQSRSREASPSSKSLIPPRLTQDTTSTVPHSLSPPPGIYDWAGVTGRWRRLICFCDYRDLSTYNELLSGERYSTESATSLFDYDEFSEAVHVLSVNMCIVGVDHDYGSDDGSATASRIRRRWPERPKLEVRGETSYQGRHMSNMRGNVRMTPDGEIRWELISEMEGEARWSSVGIQVGAPGSAMGVVGVWTGVEHDPHDPAGPFWFFKVD